MIRLCLDVNVWIAHYLTMARRPDTPGAASGLARATLAGACRAGPVQLVVSHAMLDTLEAVMRRLLALALAAEMARDQVELAAGRSCLSETPSIILGGSSAYALLDQEDAGVLNVAMAGRADLLVTSNLAHFIRGPRARTDTDVVSRDGKIPDVVRLSHPKLPGGLVLASPFQAARWLLRRVPPPAGVSIEREAPFD